MGRNHGKHFGNNHHRKRPYQSTQNNTTRPARQNVIYSSLKENEIGITEYTTTTNGFTGIIKQRISDFHVHEIGFDGKLCELENFSIPQPPKNENASNESEKADLIRLITQEKFDAILAIEKADKQCNDEVLIDATSMEKTERTQIHQLIKGNFSSVNSTTFDKDDRKFIKCTKLNRKHDRRRQWVWPHEYTYFLLHKDNIDTMQAVSSLASFLGISKASAITYAGTKDKRGRTTQWACVRQREPSMIVAAAQKARHMYVGGFTFRDEPLKLGMLQGNRFRIALRQVTAADDDVIEALKTFKEKGFINYYGHQRFGNHSEVPTHKIGLYLVQGNFKEACECILKPRANDVPDMHAVRQLWWKKRNAKEALELLKRHDRSGRSIEYKLLSGFVKNGPNDYVNSLESIPRNARLMYIHAYQSLIWNEMVSRRIATYGLQLCEGDLVFVDKNDADNEIIDVDVDDDDSKDDKKEEITDTESVQENTNVSRFQAMVKPLTKIDIDSNKYNIFDVVLPLPGYDITYPSNDCSQWYEERLKQDDLSSEKLKRKQKGYSLTGAYRKAFIKLVDLNWYFMNYDTETDVLIQSDVEKIRGEAEPKSMENGKQKALILTFTLPSSSYATMALREIMKCDTSVANQVQLQQATVAIEQTPVGDKSQDECNIETKQPKLDVASQ
ncbi:pseudouridylate synthase 7 homolog [Contarinia nasturtii]|uniref:pseudouridylate synthase 7 homolog n=1 Tax=Contarinia nasturtii TaxID=265458 RepID=UPI0012D37E67|nr:pseudouridylate synthase 7 homolog [Contarinia nasturtii]